MKPRHNAEQMVGRFFRFIEERHAIWHRRFELKLPWPWTADPLLRKYRFCNIFRELDTVTIWIRDNWRLPYADHPNLWFMMCVARQINWPGTLAEMSEIGFPDIWNPHALVNLMRERKARGEQVYTGAYMLRGGQKGVDKAFYTVYTVLDPLWKEGPNPFRVEGLDTLEGWWTWLNSHPGWGPFLSYEVVTDLRHTRYLRDAPDVNTFANAGPGAWRGLCRIYGRDKSSGNKPDMALTEMTELLRMSPIMLPSFVPALELRDVEHSLCEFDKYERARLNEGSPKTNYHPPKPKEA